MGVELPTICIMVCRQNNDLMNFPVWCHTPLIAKVEKDELGGALEEAENALEQEENKVGNIQRSFFF